MAIGTPAQLGHAINLLSGSAFAVSGSAPADIIVVGITPNDSSATVASVTDNAGNSYQLAVRHPAAGTFESTEIWYALNTVIPTAITVNTSSGNYKAAAISCSGLMTASAIDVTNSAAFAAATSLSISTGALAQAAELIFTVAGSANFGTWTEGAGFTGQPFFSAAIRTASQVVASAGSVTYAPSWTTPAAGTVCIATFKGGGPPPTPFLMPQGVM